MEEGKTSFAENNLEPEISVVEPSENAPLTFLNKIMYVNAPIGLRVRSLPSVDGEIIGLLEHMSEVIIAREDNYVVTVNDIEGKWVYIKTPIEGWIFDGFLTARNQNREEIIRNALIKQNLQSWSPRYDFNITHIQRINIGIYNMICYIVIIELDGVQLEYNFIGLQNNEIIIEEFLGWGFIVSSQFALEATYSIINNSNFTQVGNNLVFIGDINHDGNDDVIIISALEHNTIIEIFGVNKERDIYQGICQQIFKDQGI